MNGKQRAKIYRKAAELMFENIGNTATRFHCCCPTIAHVSGIGINHHEEIDEIDYPELYQFRPVTDEGIMEGPWWERGWREPRILALLLCEQMCLNP